MAVSVASLSLRAAVLFVSLVHFVRDFVAGSESDVSVAGRRVGG